MPHGKVAILGAGLMGAGIASDFLAAGYDVAVTVSSSTSPVEARSRVEAALDGPAPRLSVAEGTRQASVDAQLVLESLPEDAALKHRELRIAERAAPHALIATNTSSLSVARVAEGMHEPSRLVGIHYLNPPAVFRVVEVIPGAHADPRLVQRAAAFVRSVGKSPLVLKRDIPGFLINRLQMALLRECVHLVDADVASAEDIDRLMEQGLGRRWAALGPFATASLGGPALFERIATEVYPSLANDRAPTNGVTRRALTDGELAELEARRRRTLEHLADVLDTRLSDDDIHER